MTSIIEVTQLRKCYGSLAAVDSISFDVKEGEIFGMVGPNGAGKTTTIECVEGLRRPDGGSVRLLGKDPIAGRREIAGRMGIQLQEFGSAATHARQGSVGAVWLIPPASGGCQ